jgi:hypothetical protein
VHRTGWNGRDEEGRAASPGIYFVRLTTGAGVFRARTVKIE